MLAINRQSNAISVQRPRTPPSPEDSGRQWMDGSVSPPLERGVVCFPVSWYFTCAFKLIIQINQWINE